MKMDQIHVAAARAAHEANRAWCLAHGDDSQLPWHDAPQWQRESALDGVEAIVEDCRLNAVDLHERWCSHKRASGWSYGPVKDPARKTHPCLVSFHDLPPMQRAKDSIFAEVVKAVLRAGGAIPRL